MGRLNRLIEIQRKVITRDPRFGSEIVTWVKLDTLWAELVQVKPAERLVVSQFENAMDTHLREGQNSELTLATRTSARKRLQL